MSAVLESFRLELKPVANREAAVQVGAARFTLLTDRLIRLEYDPTGQFEDRPTQAIWYREQPVPVFNAKTSEDGIEIETDCLSLSYRETGGGFTPDSLTITVKTTGAVWHPGDTDGGNLKGTTRTLDYTNGATPLTNGLMSRSGWAVLDDSGSLVLNDAYWVEPRENHETDLYFFGYGHDYKACLRDYCKVSGDMPLIPRWILGNWWSRYWHYTQAELTQLLDDFEAHQIPLSVCIVDMDWHLTKTGNRSTGWTGYTWNRELFPDPEGFIALVHEKGLRTALNLHPAEGIHNHEEGYSEMARRMGIDPASGEAVEFDITDPTFAKAYLEVMHHPHEAMGVDFWWIDWQQGQKSRIAELDPLWLINHLHFYDLGRDGTRRPFIFSRWGNEGHQRYPIGFSGDSYMTWDTLRFEPYMTATSSNIAYGWWSHDIGGHTSGVGDAELFARWVQFGVLSPIMRIHSTKGAFYDQRPWAFENAEVRNVLRDAMQFRHQLIPYLYTMAHRANRDSLPLMLPMYYEYPEAEAAYFCPQQYLFGSELVAAPFVEPIDPETGLSRQVVWLPEGDWYHFFTGQHYAGDRHHAIYGALKDIPLFARAGAIVPLSPKVGWGGIDNPDELHVHIFAGDDGSFTLYEDDGETRDFQNGTYCETTFAQKWSGSRLDFTMDAPTCDTSLLPAGRLIHLHVHGVTEANVAVHVDGVEVAAAQSYDAQTETLHIGGIAVSTTEALGVTLRTANGSLLSRRDRTRETLLRYLRSMRLHSGVRNRIYESLDTILANPEELAPFLLPMSDSHKRVFFELLYEAGIHHIADAHDPTLLILWNNRDDQDITFRYSDVYLHFGMVKQANQDRGVLPRFAALTPKVQTWHHGAVGEHSHRTQWHLQVDYHNLATIHEQYRELTP